jgi:oligopeptide/dipeptide ABC transporter ATP-binding protein
MIAIGLACEPKLLIADEPTTALDVTVQARILELLRGLQEETGVAIVFITHDLGVVSEFCDRALVMYAGQAMEAGWTDQLLSAPKHPYTAGLLGAAQMRRDDGRLVMIPGVAPRPGAPVSGCRFHPRCSYRERGRCDVSTPMERSFGEGHAGRCLRSDEIALAGVSAP